MDEKEFIKAKKIIDLIFHKLVKIMEYDLCFNAISEVKIEYNKHTKEIILKTYCYDKWYKKVFTKDEIETILKESDLKCLALGFY